MSTRDGDAIDENVNAGTRVAHRIVFEGRSTHATDLLTWMELMAAKGTGRYATSLQVGENAAVTVR